MKMKCVSHGRVENTRLMLLNRITKKKMKVKREKLKNIEPRMEEKRTMKKKHEKFA